LNVQRGRADVLGNLIWHDVVHLDHICGSDAVYFNISGLHILQDVVVGCATVFSTKRRTIQIATRNIGIVRSVWKAWSAKCPVRCGLLQVGVAFTAADQKQK